MGPGMVPRKSFRVAVSYFRPCSGSGGAYTVYPSCCRRWTTPFQLPESAHAPCSSTIVGLGPAAARLGRGGGNLGGGSGREQASDRQDGGQQAEAQPG